MSINGLLVPISIGEVIDKITILEIKTERIHDKDKLENVSRELSAVNSAIRRYGVLMESIVSLQSQLKEVNERLWEIEDAIREKERLSEFDSEFIELARSVYLNNDERANLKRAINSQLGSDLTEEKSYADYNATRD